MDISKKFPENIKYKKMLRGGNQKQIAVNTNFSVNYIHKILNGHRAMNSKVLAEILRFNDFNNLVPNEFDVSLSKSRV